MKWFTEEKWSAWSKPCYSGGGDFTQVRFRLSDKKMEKRSMFVNIGAHEVDAAWADAESVEAPNPKKEGEA